MSKPKPQPKTRKPDHTPFESLPQSPSSVLKVIGREFNRLRQGSAPQAYRYAQHALNEYVDVLVPAIISLDHFWALVVQMEDHLKGASDTPGATPEEALEKFLNGDETVVQ